MYFIALHMFAVSEEVRKHKLSKFTKKYMTGTVDGQIYLKECLQKCLLALLVALLEQYDRI